MKRKTILVLAVVFLTPISSFADMVFTGDGEHTVDYYVNGFLYAKNTTTVNLLSGATIEKSLYARDNSKVNMSGGLVVNNFYGYEYSELMILGGTITGTTSTPLNGWLSTHNNSRAYIYGGTFNHSGYNAIEALDQSVITLYGQNFSVNGTSVNSSILTHTSAASYTRYSLAGFLSTGEPLSIDCTIYGNSAIELNVVPVPSAVILGSIGMGFASWRLRKMKRYNKEVLL